VSLTSILGTKEARAFLKGLIINPRMPEKLDILIEPTTNSYTRMGTGFDYAARFGLEKRFDTVIRRPNLVAEDAVHLIIQNNNGEIYDSSVRELNRALESIERVGEDWSGVDGIEAAKACLQLADFDVVYRTGRVFPTNPISNEEANELLELYRSIPWSFYADFHSIYVNPTFGACTSRVRGADADIVVDDLLIDIKTTKKPNLDLDMVRQLVGYALLCNKSGIDGDRGEASPYEIRRVGIYFSRSVHLHVMNLEDCIADESRGIVLDYILNHPHANTKIEVD
jgi:hypothetical protein